MQEKLNVKNNRNNKNSKHSNKALKRTAIVVGVVLALLIIIDLTPFGGNIAAYTKWAQCGHRPVGTSFGGAFTNGLPYYTEAEDFGLFRGATPYFCTPMDAERAGYSTNEDHYDFPNLPKSDQRSSIEKGERLMGDRYSN
ncbi:MAG: hypothetical protein ABI397_01690 [Candidatus Saccharimonas sp.]